MTVRISPQKTSRILRYFFRGISQPVIANRCGINQATVSRYASSLKEDADDMGIIAAAKEYGVMHEVDSLRSLAVELSKNKLTVEEAKEGMIISKLFNKLGVPPAEYETLIKVISKLKTSGFVPAAMELAQLENTTGKTSSELVDQFEHLSSEITQLQQTRATLQQESNSLEQDIKKLAMSKKKEAQTLRELKQEVREQQTQVTQEMKKANLTLDRIKKLESATKILEELGVPDDKLKVYVSEHQELEKLGVGWDNFVNIVEGMKNDR